MNEIIAEALRFFESLGYRACHMTGSVILAEQGEIRLLCSVVSGVDMSVDPTELAMSARQMLLDMADEQDEELAFGLLNVQRMPEGQDEWLDSFLYLGTASDTPSFGKH